MKILTVLALLSVWSLSSRPAAAADIPVATIGTGQFSCGKFIEYQQAPKNEGQMWVIVQWVWGYMVAFNKRGFFDVQIGHAVKQITYPDSATVLLFLHGFCEKYPLSSVVNGTIAMVKLVKQLGGPIVWRPAD